MEREKVNEKSLKLHKEKHGKLEIKSKFPLKNREDLSIAYTPGVAAVCSEIHSNPDSVYDYTIKRNSVAIVTDGSAVLGLGNIGPKAALPVMEGKAILFKEFADIDAYPICLDTQDPKKIIEAVKLISPSFGGINLEDIKAPQCFEIEKELQDLGIPVMHDDQHGTAVVVLAGIINAVKISEKNKESRIVISGAGAAGIAITKILLKYGFKNITVCDTKGAIHSKRKDLTEEKIQISRLTNLNSIEGSLTDALKNADIFIGVSKPNVLTKEMIKSMNKKPIIFALSNPVPEIMPDEAKEASAFIIATGRSDFPNQVNNVLAFPGIFRGALDIRATKITDEMKIAAAEAIAKIIKNPTPDQILPNPLDKTVVPAVAQAIKTEWKRDK